jgi:BirA family transcriptional regulator, biotin operon repressor / biotin---[acetyl-CoA-carboxylase] ligase
LADPPMVTNPHNQVCSKIFGPHKILEFLKNKKGYVPADELSRHLNISRQVLSEHINDLRDAGYEIVAVPHLGFRLESLSDRLFPFEVEHGLNTKFIGRKIYYLQRCSSTMDIAMQLASDNPSEGTIILAESQTKGRGRLGRHWVSPRYKGIYFSLMLKPKIPPSQAAVLTLLAAVSICEAVKAATGITCSIKWPNDILVNNKKLGGILTELEAELDRVNFVIIGIGINVNNEPGELLRGAVSLKSLSNSQKKVDRLELLREILRKIESNYFLFQEKKAAAILEKWKSYSLTLGQRVKISSSRAQVQGRAVAIDIDGGLLVEKDSGGLQKFMSGDVLHLR